MNKIVVNGVDGHFGRAVLDELCKLVDKSTLLLTAPAEEGLAAYRSEGYQTAIVNFNHKDNLIDTFKNADKVLLISMPFVGEKRRLAHQNCIDACVQANVKQIIYTSVLDAGNPLNPSIEAIDHGFTESYVLRTSLDYIFLRNSLFADAFISDYLANVERGENEIEKNMGHGKVAFIARRDAAKAAAHSLANPFFHNEIFSINGSKLVSYQDFLDIANRVTGNNIAYKELTDEELYAFFDSIGVPRTTDGDFSKSPLPSTSEGMVTFGTNIREGYLDIAINDYPHIVGSQPVSLEYMFENPENYLIGERNPVDD